MALVGVIPSPIEQYSIVLLSLPTVSPVLKSTTPLLAE
jgi:hypothetical protein